MRLLHTSDWHLGRTLHGADLLEHQGAVLDLVVDAVVQERIDAVVVAGDIYDRSVPPTRAVELLDDTLCRLADHAVVVLTPGNHDSATRLGFGAGLFRSGIHVRTDVGSLAAPIELADAHGPVLVYALPFLHPDLARYQLAGDDEQPLVRSHQACLAEAMRRVKAGQVRRSADSRSVVVAHAFVVGTAASPVESDSERDLKVGGVGSVDAAIFDGVDYVALGHLHRAQEPRSGGSATKIRYSGSPLRYSFSEATQEKSLSLVDLDARGATTITEIPVPQPKPMAVLAGRFVDLVDTSQFQELTDAWVQVTVTDDARPRGMYEGIRERFPHALVVRHEPVSGPLAHNRVAPIASLDAVAVTRQFVEFVTGGEATTAEVDAFRSAYESVRDCGGNG